MLRAAFLVLLIWLLCWNSWGKDSQNSIMIQASLVRREPRKGHWTDWLEGGFAPNALEVGLGEKLTLELHPAAGRHRLAVPDFHLRSEEVGPGETARISFVADRVGEFPIHCDSSAGCFHRRFVGSLLVRTPDDPGKP